jgi:glycosyltransferase involved in cell wall biosynthesis
LIESEELRKKMGKAGRKTVEEKFSVDAIKNRYLNLFNKVISE